MVNAWPMHPKPKEDELFSSWVLRAAHANGCKLSTLFSIAAPGLKNISKNIDNAISEKHLKSLSQFLNTPYERAKNTVLQSYEGWLFERTTPKAKRKLGVLHTGTPKHEKYRCYLQYCPVCLASDTPYYRKSWRIAFVTVCTEHGVRLLDQCPNCFSSVQPILLMKKHKYSALNKSLAECHACGFNLSFSPIERGCPDVLKSTQEFHDVLKCGYYKLTDTKWIYSFSFFSVLRHMVRCCTAVESVENSARNIREFERLPIESRYATIRLLSKFFGNWPCNAIRFCRSNDIKFYELEEIEKANGNIPFWFLSKMKPALYKPKIPPSYEEIESAFKFMIEKENKNSLLRLNQIMGYSDSGIIKKIYKSLVNYT